MRRPTSLLCLLGLAACASPAPTPNTPNSPAPAATASAPAANASAPTNAQLFSLFEDDFKTCYEQGKRMAPNMGAGKVTWLFSVSENGAVECVVPTDDTGFGQTVEDCMSQRIGRERFPAGGEWSAELPVRVKEGSMGLGEARTSGLETLETHGLDDASVAVQQLLPALQRCAQPVDGHALQVIHVSGRVGADGHVTCAMASASAAVSHDVRACSAAVLDAARFPVPKGGVGLVSIPIKILH